MTACGICAGRIDGARLTDPDTGDAFHPACLAERVPEDAVVLLLAAAIVLIAPAIVVWAG